MRPLDEEGVRLLKQFDRDYRQTKQALFQRTRFGFSGRQSARKDMIVLGERLRAIGAGFRPSRPTGYYMVIVDGLLKPCNPFGP